MKSLNVLVVLGVILLLVTCAGIATVHAQTLTKDFGETNFNSSGGGVFCKIDVTATIQTDPNGDWIKNNTYQINWFIQITYLNQSMYNPNDFSIVCYNPQNPVDDTVVQNVINDTTTVTPQENGFGFLAMTFRPESAPKTFQLDSAFALNVYFKGHSVASGSWLQSFNNQPININVLNHQTNPSPTVPELTPIALMVGLIAVSTMALLIRKRQFGKQKK